MVPTQQRTLLDILASEDVRVNNKGDNKLANVRDQTMYVLASALEQLVEDGNKIESNSGGVPDVPIDVYLQRFFKYTPCKKDTFVASLIYLDRITRTYGTIIDSTNIHRLFLTSSLIAAKLVEDVTNDCPFNNKMFAVVGGVPLAEMNDLEMEFVEGLEYRVHIFPSEFQEYHNAVNARVAAMRDAYMKTYGDCSELENDSDESSAYMIYSLVFDSYKKRNKKIAAGSGDIKHSSASQTSQEFSHHMGSGVVEGRADKQTQKQTGTEAVAREC